MTKYNLEERITDPRVRKRCETALQFAYGFVNARKPKSLSTRYIDRYFGQSQNPLSNTLRQMLLTVFDEKYYSPQFAVTCPENRGVCKLYVRNKKGCKKLHNLLYPELKKLTNAKVEWHYVMNLGNTHQTEFTTGDFTYKQSSDRLFHPLQNVESSIRQRLFAHHGYNHVYDIVCAAPTVFVNVAWSLGLCATHTSSIVDYINNRHAKRYQWAKQLGCTEDTVKRVVNALFNGARISHWHGSAILCELDGNHNTLTALKQHAEIQQLKSEISGVWNHISHALVNGNPYIKRIVNPITNRKLAVSGKQKSDLYRQYERRIMNEVKQYMRSQNAKMFLEHDGWSSDRPVNLQHMTAHIANQTGMQHLQFDYKYVP